jgi:hypothetical protein
MSQAHKLSQTRLFASLFEQRCIMHAIYSSSSSSIFPSCVSSVTTFFFRIRIFFPLPPSVHCQGCSEKYIKPCNDSFRSLRAPESSVSWCCLHVPCPFISSIQQSVAHHAFLYFHFRFRRSILYCKRCRYVDMFDELRVHFIDNITRF